MWDRHFMLFICSNFILVMLVSITAVCVRCASFCLVRVLNSFVIVTDLNTEETMPFRKHGNMLAVSSTTLMYLFVSCHK